MLHIMNRGQNSAEAREQRVRELLGKFMRNADKIPNAVMGNEIFKPVFDFNPQREIGQRVCEMYRSTTNMTLEQRPTCIINHLNMIIIGYNDGHARTYMLDRLEFFEEMQLTNSAINAIHIVPKGLLFFAENYVYFSKGLKLDPQYITEYVCQRIVKSLFVYKNMTFVADISGHIYLLTKPHSKETLDRDPKFLSAELKLFPKDCNIETLCSMGPLKNVFFVTLDNVFAIVSLSDLDKGYPDVWEKGILKTDLFGAVLSQVYENKVYFKGVMEPGNVMSNRLYVRDINHMFNNDKLEYIDCIHPTLREFKVHNWRIMCLMDFRRVIEIYKTETLQIEFYVTTDTDIHAMHLVNKCLIIAKWNGEIHSKRLIDDKPQKCYYCCNIAFCHDPRPNIICEHFLPNSETNRVLLTLGYIE